MFSALYMLKTVGTVGTTRRYWFPAVPTFSDGVGTVGTTCFKASHATQPPKQKPLHNYQHQRRKYWRWFRAYEMRTCEPAAPAQAALLRVRTLQNAARVLSLRISSKMAAEYLLCDTLHYTISHD